MGGIGIPPWGKIGSGQLKAAVHKLVNLETQLVTTSNNKSEGKLSSLSKIKKIKLKIYIIT